jgi:hypothetical protein
MNARKTQALLSAACVLSLVALALIVWSLFDPRPIPVVAAMSIGQVLGTLSFAAFGYVALADLRARLAAGAKASGAAAGSDDDASSA